MTLPKSSGVKLSELTLYVEGSPANRTPWLESVRDLLTSVICGRKLSAVFAKLNPDGSWVKTSQDSFLPMMDECLPPFSGTWPRWGTMRRGVVYELPILERPTEESGYSFWPTAVASEGGTGLDPSSRGRKLWNEAENWPTPVANDAEKRGNFDPIRSPGLAASALNWLTPCANDDNKSVEAHMAMKARMKGGARNIITSLQVAVQAWPTPTREDGEASGARRGVPDTLTSAAAMWRTPCSRDHHPSSIGNRSRNIAQVQLAHQVESFQMFPTPNTRDWKSEEGYPRERMEEHAPSLSQFCHHFHPAPQIERHGPTSSTDGPGSRPPSAKRKLNPCFVEWLMGFPIHWTHAPGGLRRSATRLSRKSPSSSEK